MRAPHTVGDPRVFVFGSNLAGIHAAGAADYARVCLGARWGVGEGPTGHTYALPTCKSPGIPLSLAEVAGAVVRFLIHAAANPDVTFYVTAVGCGIAGFDEDQIAPLFRSAPSNCDLPDGWRK